MEELKEWIMTELPDNGEWWDDGYEQFIDSAEKLLTAGVGVHLIKEIFSDLYGAVADEYAR